MVAKSAVDEAGLVAWCMRVVTVHLRDVTLGLETLGNRLKVVVVRLDSQATSPKAVRLDSCGKRPRMVVRLKPPGKTV